MKKTSLASSALILSLLTLNIHANEKNLSVAEVLKHTPESLAEKLGDRSEAGEDESARLWAAAKRIETDSLLGKKSVQSVQRLDQWRQVLNSWEDLKLQARGIESGGGSMWSHLSARNDASIEGFLAKHMVALSAKPKTQAKAFNSDYLKTINATISTGLKELGEDNEHMKEYAEKLKDELENAYLNLKFMLNTLPEGELKKAVIKMVKPVSN